MVDANLELHVLLTNVTLQVKAGGIYHPSGGALRVCRFSLDGTMLIAAGDDEKASLWRMKTRSLIKYRIIAHSTYYNLSKDIV